MLKDDPNGAAAAALAATSSTPEYQRTGDEAVLVILADTFFFHLIVDHIRVARELWRTLIFRAAQIDFASEQSASDRDSDNDGMMIALRWFADKD